MNAHRKNKLTARSKQNRLRIIGGMWRGRKLEFPNVAGLRPTGDRIRETVFNWLAPTIGGAHCLDAFSGSGALAFEALSRGAANAILLESDPIAIRQLNHHKQLLGAENATIMGTDALRWLTETKPAHAMDVVFLDPPFSSTLLQPAIDALEDGNWLTSGSMIYIETATDNGALQIPTCWQLTRSKSSGEVCYQLYSRE